MEETKPCNNFNNMQQNTGFFNMETSPGMASERKANWNLTQAEAQAQMEGMENEMGGASALDENGNPVSVSYQYRNYEDLPSLPKDINKEQLVEGIQERFNTNNWMKINEAIDQLRCINKQYPMDMNEVCKIFWQHIVSAIQNLRSAVSKNTLMFIGELFAQSQGYKLYDEIINAFAPVILTKCFQEKNFIKVEAQKAVQAMVNNCVYDSTLLSLCKGCFHKNFNICELSAKAMLEMIQKFGENISKLKNETFRDLFLTLAKVIFSWVK